MVNSGYFYDRLPVLKSKKMTNEKIITANKLTKRFGDFVAVNEISFEVNKGEIFGFLGANGAGKTTAMRMLCGLSLPTSGAATVAGFDVYKENEKIKKSIGYMSQKFSLYEDLTVKENMRFYGGIYGKSDQFIKEKTAFVLDHLHLEKEANKLVKSLPLGWKQKLAFSVAIFHEPVIVFLDEPTVADIAMITTFFFNNKFMGIGNFCCFNYLFFTCFLLTDSNVARNCIVE